MKKALIENVQLTLTDSRSCCWSHGFLNCLVRLGVIEHPSDVIVDGLGTILKSINMDDVNDSISQTVNTDWGQLRSVDPRSLNDEQGDGIKSITFARWMMSLEDVQHTSYTKLLNARLASLAFSFLSSATWAAVASATWAGAASAAGAEDSSAFRFLALNARQEHGLGSAAGSRKIGGMAGKTCS